jgi:hypothetical protein
MMVDWNVMGWQTDRLAVLATVWPFNSWDQNSCHGDDPEIQPVLWELPATLRHIGTGSPLSSSATTATGWMTCPGWHTRYATGR